MIVLHLGKLWDSVTDHVCLCGMWTITELCLVEEIRVTNISDKYSFYSFKSHYCGQILLNKRYGMPCLMHSSQLRVGLSSVWLPGNIS